MSLPPNKYTKLALSVASVLPSYLRDINVPQALVVDWEIDGMKKLVHSGLWGYAHLYAQIHKREGSVLRSTTGYSCRDEWMADIYDMVPAADNTVQLVGHIIVIPGVEVCSKSRAFFNTFIEFVNAYYQTIAHPKWSNGVFFMGTINETERALRSKFSLVAVMPSNFNIGALAAISSFIRNALLVWALGTLPKKLQKLNVCSSFTPLIGGEYDVYALQELISDEIHRTPIELPHRRGSLWAHVFTLCDPIKDVSRVRPPLTLLKEGMHQNPTSVAPHELKNIYTPFCGIDYGANAYSVNIAMCQKFGNSKDSYAIPIHNAFLQAVRQVHSTIKR